MSSVGLSHTQKQATRHGGIKFGKPVKNTFQIFDSGTNRVSTQQFYALHSLYHTHPAIAAARTVLHSQLFSGGLQLVRDGEALKVVGDNDDGGGVKQAFNRHLQESWLSFAKDVCDSFLTWGLTAVIFDLDDDGDNVARAARSAKEDEQIAQPRKRARSEAAAKRLVPKVPLIGSYDVGWEMIGRYGYSRRYVLYSQSPGASISPDEQAVVFVRSHPDSAGNLNSPLATIHSNASFVTSLQDLALMAEVSRSQPQIVTQLRKEERSTGLDPGSLFFDSESRNMASGQEHEESENAAKALEMQAALCGVINRMQGSGEGPAPSNKPATSNSTFHAPEIPPRLFTLPKQHELAPNLQKPESRGDLENLHRLSMDIVSSAMGVPSSLLFEGRFSGKSTQQLQLLNATIAQLALSINHVLTKTYLALYPDEAVSLTGERVEAPQSGNLELKLRVSPLSVGEEIVSYFGAGLIDIETAIPAAMHGIGAGVSEVDAALKRAQQRREEDRAVLLKEQETNVGADTVDANERPIPTLSSSSSPSSPPPLSST